jgi:hypothetical protein
MNSALEEAKKSLTIKTVTLKNAQIDLSDDTQSSDLLDASISVQTFNGVPKVNEKSLEEGKETSWNYSFFYNAGIRLVDDDEAEDPNVLAEIQATFIASYSSKEKISKEAIEKFSEDNVGYHVWPYWREFVQSSCLRLNIKPLEIPLYICTGE